MEIMQLVADFERDCDGPTIVPALLPCHGLVAYCDWVGEVNHHLRMEILDYPKRNGEKCVFFLQHVKALHLDLDTINPGQYDHITIHGERPVNPRAFCDMIHLGGLGVSNFYKQLQRMIKKAPKAY